MKRVKKEPKQGSWMDTYGDMVTLLLCFFVLLYSISSVDQQKWEKIVKSFNPEAAESDSQVVTDTTLEQGDDDVPGAMEKPETARDEFDELYYTLEAIVEGQGLSETVEISQGEGYTFITFQDVVFFDGYSSIIKDAGKQMLLPFIQAMTPVEGAIQQVEVLGHTAQVQSGIINEVHTDRTLSAARSAEVVAFIQENSTITPSKLVSVGYGEYRPISPADTAESRARNRRVEILITKNDAVEKTLDEYYKEVYGE